MTARPTKREKALGAVTVFVLALVPAGCEKAMPMRTYEVRYLNGARDTIRACLVSDDPDSFRFIVGFGDYSAIVPRDSVAIVKEIEP